VNAIRAAVPDAKISIEESHGYPIKVTVSDVSGQQLWQGDQRNLFRKYPDQRQKSVQEITAAVKKFYIK
jgi:hypothetical protein